MGPGAQVTFSPSCAIQLSPVCVCPLSIPTMLSVHSEQLHKTGFPTVHAVVLLEGTMNLTGEIQPLVEQLMMVKRMQVGGGPVAPLSLEVGGLEQGQESPVSLVKRECQGQVHLF